MKLCLSFLLTLSALVLSSCDASPAPPIAATVAVVPAVPESSPSPFVIDAASTPGPTSTPMLTSQIGLPRLRGATHVSIVDSWNGLSPVAPVTARYSLENSSSGLKGEGNFSVGYVSESAVATVTVPPEVVAKFFSFLEDPAMPVQEGTYEPLITHTDDYPSLTIGLTLPDGEQVTFFSKSQGADNVPWGLQYEDKTYIVNSTRPAEALDALKPYLQEDILDGLKAKLLERHKTPSS